MLVDVLYASSHGAPNYRTREDNFQLQLLVQGLHGWRGYCAKAEMLKGACHLQSAGLGSSSYGLFIIRYTAGDPPLLDQVIPR